MLTRSSGSQRPGEENIEENLSSPTPSNEAVATGRGILRFVVPTAPTNQSIGRGLLAIRQPQNVSDESGDTIRARLRKNPPPTQHFITLAEAADHMSERTRNIVVLPPHAGDQGSIATDEDDEEEEEPEPVGEIELDSDGGQDTNEEDDVPQVRWRRNSSFEQELETAEPIVPMVHQYPILATMSEFQLWKEVFDEDVFGLILQQTLLYGRRDLSNLNFKLSYEELERFLGIVLLSGYHCIPRERDYWSNQIDLKVELVSDVMSRDRFSEIKRAIHLADNHSLQPGNKMAKVEPLYNLLNRALQRCGIFHENLSIDESMVPYKGRHSARMFMKGKPIRFGYKIWTLAGSDGYPYASIIYQGRSTTAQIEPLGSSVVKRLLTTVERLSQPAKHNIFFDNFFTSYQLLVDLKESNFKATGTIRPNRMNGAAKIFEGDKQLKAEGRGHFDFRCDGKVFIAKWFDNSVVHIASNNLTHEPILTAKRRVGREQINVPQPFLIKRYNQGMGGVDALDRLLQAYRPHIISKKWWWPLFLNAINLSVVAAWRLHTVLHPTGNLTHLDFLRNITLCLLKTSGSRARLGGGQHVPLPNDIRYDGIGHYSTATSQGRCAVCSSNTRSKCEKCNVRLHFAHEKPCFNIYHNN